MQTKEVSIRRKMLDYQSKRRKNFQTTPKNVNRASLFILPNLANGPAYVRGKKEEVSPKSAAKKAAQELESKIEGDYIMNFFNRKKNKAVNEHLHTARMMSILGEIIEKGYKSAYEEASDNIIRKYMLPYEKMNKKQLWDEMNKLSRLRTDSAKRLLSS